MFNWSLSQEMEKYKKLKVVTEAPEDTEINTGVVNNEAGAKEMGSTDYDAAAAEMDDVDQDGAPDEGTESAENDVEEMEADDYNEDGAEGEEGDDLEAEEYGEEGEEGTEDVPEEEPVPEENGDKSKNRFLVREYIQLYYDVENIIKKLNNNHKTSLIRSEIYLQVSNNLTDMNQMLFEYLKNDFSHKSYLFNLYQFNLFLEFINVNAEIMAKCNELQSNEQTNK